MLDYLILRNILKMSSTVKINSCEIYERWLSAKIYSPPYAWKIHPRKYISTKETSFTVIVITLTSFATYTTGSEYLFCKFCISWLMHVHLAFRDIFPFMFHSFPYENLREYYKKLAWRSWPMLFTLTDFSYTYTFLLCWKIKSCFDRCFPQ